MPKHIFNQQIIKKGKTEYSRTDRIAKEIKVILSDIFAKAQLKDTLLFDKMVLISQVFVTGDLSLAKVYVSSWNMNIAPDLLITTLNKHIPFFRRKIAKALKIKVIPNLIFIIETQFDKMDQAAEMFKTIENDSKSNDS